MNTPGSPIPSHPITAPPPYQGAFDPDKSIVITCSPTPGSFSLTAYRLTPKGVEWGKANMKETGDVVQGYSPAMYDKAQLLLSDRFLGFYLVPGPDGVWSYNFMGIKHSLGMDYTLMVGNPKVRSLPLPSHIIWTHTTTTTKPAALVSNPSPMPCRVCLGSAPTHLLLPPNQPPQPHDLHLLFPPSIHPP